MGIRSPLITATRKDLPLITEFCKSTEDKGDWTCHLVCTKVKQLGSEPSPDDPIWVMIGTWTPGSEDLYHFFDPIDIGIYSYSSLESEEYEPFWCYESQHPPAAIYKMTREEIGDLPELE